MFELKYGLIIPIILKCEQNQWRFTRVHGLYRLRVTTFGSKIEKLQTSYETQLRASLKIKIKHCSHWPILLIGRWKREREVDRVNFLCWKLQLLNIAYIFESYIRNIIWRVWNVNKILAINVIWSCLITYRSQEND